VNPANINGAIASSGPWFLSWLLCDTKLKDESMATILESIRWFKKQFREEIESAIITTPFSLDLLTAIAVQETFYIWGTLAARGMRCNEILALCTGDTLDYPKRRAFPRTKEALLRFPQGQQMFAIAHEALEAVGSQINAYAGVAQKPDKYCHGFGIFQFDLQFFKVDDKKPFFLERRWYSFSDCFHQCLESLGSAQDRTSLVGKTKLSDLERVYVAIAYNCGHVDINGGLKQGYKNNDGTYYGESVWEYLQLAHAIQ